jgi:AcrR family transcriptional regulator
MSTATERVEGGLEREIRRILNAAEDVRSGARREGDLLRPLGKKARRTRAALLTAAYENFTAKGYRSTSVQDIHEAAGVSLGTFYQYFRDKADIMSTLVAESVILSAESMFPSLDVTEGEAGPRRVVEGFVRNYAASADFVRVWEEVTQIEPSVADFRRRVSRILDAGVRDAIVEGQRAGTVDPHLDAPQAARALAAMVDRYCYVTFVVEGNRDEATIEQAIAVLGRLWTNALGMTT